MTFSPNIEVRCDTPDNSQLYEPPAPPLQANNHNSVRGIATQYGQGDRVPWNMSTQLLSQLFEQEQDNDSLVNSRDDLLNPPWDDNADRLHKEKNLPQVSDARGDVTE